jgi:hypothetical protein
LGSIDQNIPSSLPTVLSFTSPPAATAYLILGMMTRGRYTWRKGNANSRAAGEEVKGKGGTLAERLSSWEDRIRT